MSKVIYKRCIEDIDIQNQSFTQSLVGKSENVSVRLIRDYSYKAQKNSVRIYSARIVNTKEGVSIEGQCLTGKKLAITGSIKVKLIFCSKKYKNQTETLCTDIPFSTFIVVPKEIDKDMVHCICYYVEDIDVAAISCDKLYISIIIFLQYNNSVDCIGEEK